MGTLLEVLAILAILSSFFLCYMSWKTWRAFQIVAMELTFLAAVTFTYMAARTLKTHQAWRENARSWKMAVDKAELENQQLAHGKEEANRVLEEGIEQVRSELAMLVNERGTAWMGVAPKKINPDSGVCEVVVEEPDPHEIAAKSVLFVFDDQPIEQGGSYLGEFKVTKAAAKSTSIEIEPNLPLTNEQKLRLKRSKGPWSLYAMMPVDNPELFAGMDEAERQKIVPRPSLKEFASATRQHRDYEYLFHRDAVEMELLADQITKVTADTARAAADEQRALGEVKYRQAEKADLTADLAKFRSEQQAVAKLAQSLEQRITALRAEFKTALTTTVRTAAQFKELQIKAAQAIDQLTDDQAAVDVAPDARP